MKREEQEFHKQVANLLNVILPARSFWWHTPNGGKRTKAEAGIFKAMGVKAGFPDIGILYLGRCFLIELKKPGEKPDMQQLAVHAQLRAAGCMVSVATNIDEVMAALAEFKIPTKGRLAA